jgi:hypothetical protein
VTAKESWRGVLLTIRQHMRCSSRADSDVLAGARARDRPQRVPEAAQALDRRDVVQAADQRDPLVSLL